VLFSMDKMTFKTHSEMHLVYGDKCFMRPVIHVWCNKYVSGQESVVVVVVVVVKE